MSERLRTDNAAANAAEAPRSAAVPGRSDGHAHQGVEVFEARPPFNAAAPETGALRGGGGVRPSPAAATSARTIALKFTKGSLRSTLLRPRTGALRSGGGVRPSPAAAVSARTVALDSADGSLRSTSLRPRTGALRGSLPRRSRPKFFPLVCPPVATLLTTLLIFASALFGSALAQESVRTLAGLPETPGAVDAAGPLARFNDPAGVVVASDGTIFVADSRNQVIRRLATNGVVSTLAGALGQAGAVDGAGGAARFDSPSGLALTADGALVVSDTGNHTLRRVTLAGAVTTLAGAAGVADFTDGAGGAARFNSPLGLAVAAGGIIFVADCGNHVIRRVTTGGAVTTFAGAGEVWGWRDGIGTNALFYSPVGVFVDAGGELLVSDANNHVIRRIATNAVVTTFAGAAGVAGAADGPATTARFGKPAELALDARGNLYVADALLHTIRKITRAGFVSTVAGAVGVDGAVDGANGVARFFNPYGLAVAPRGQLVVTDTYNQTVRELVAPFTVAVAAGGGGTVIEWEAVAGAVYQVQVKATLSAPWADLGAPVTAAGTAASAVDGGAGGTKFYRVLRAAEVGR